MVDLFWKDKKKSDIAALKKVSYPFEKIKLLGAAENALSKGDWANRLYWGDNQQVMVHLLAQFAGKIDLIYIDPPFATGTDYLLKLKVGEEISKEFGYKDNWGKNLDEYLQVMYERLILMRELLADDGLLFVHLDWHSSHYIKMMLDELFNGNFVNEIVWYYYNKYSAGKYNLPRAHDNILVYSKTNKYTFNELRIPRKKPRKQLKRESVNGVLKNVKDEKGHVVYRTVTDKKADDVWKIPCMQPASSDWTGYPTQKHPKLLERIVQIASNEGDLIADFFCGSGTTLQVAEQLKRRWIGCDNSKYAVSISLQKIKRLFEESSTNQMELLAIKSEKTQKDIDSGFFEKKIEILRGK